MSLSNTLYSASWFLPIRVLLSIIYGAVIAVRNWLYDFGLLKTFQVKTPVISIGNISVGGSGKTILTQALVQFFLDRNKLPAVLSRGYGRNTKGLFLVADKSALLGDPESSGDEPFLIASKYPGVPVAVSEDRVTGAKYLEEAFQPDVIILDDGFQHRRLQRTLDLVLLDEVSGRKNHLLPWGRLREFQQNTGRANLILYSKAGLQKRPEQNLLFKLDEYLVNFAGEKTILSEINGKFGLFAGLGNSAYFFKSVESLIGPCVEKLPLPDHVRYTPSVLDKIARNPCDFWITTEKDYIKLDPSFCQENRIYSIGVSTSIPHALLGLLNQNFNL